MAFTCCLDSTLYGLALNFLGSYSDTTVEEADLNFSCNLYRTNGKVDVSQQSCACPNSAPACAADSATVSRDWIDNISQGAKVSLSGNIFLEKRSDKSLLVVVDDLLTNCAVNENSFVLCQGNYSCGDVILFLVVETA